METTLDMHGTTVLAVIRDGVLALGGDGQVTLGNTVMKGNAKKVRRLFQGRILGGFAGHTADALTLFDRFEAKLESASGNLKKAAVDLSKDWRADRVLRRLEALLLVGDRSQILLLSGQGDVLEPDEPVMAIGSGGSMAQAAARGLFRFTSLSAPDIVKSALEITAEQCIYTNTHITVETL